MRSDFVERDVLGHLLFALTDSNRLACMVSLETGLRIDDVLSLPASILNHNSFTVIEKKTGKKKRCRLSKGLRQQLANRSGEFYVFPHRYDEHRHRTRQAVNADLKRAARLFRVKLNVTPHSMRKAYAVDLMRRSGGNLSRVSAALNHDSSQTATTLIYALADVLQNGFEPPSKKK